MDFGVDTIVYIILGIVFLVAQASKKKKAQAKRVSANSEEDGNDDGGSPPSLMEEFFNKNTSDSYVTNAVESEASPQEDSPPLFSDRLDADVVLFDNLSEEKMEDLPEDNVSEAIDDPDEGSMQVPDFDLRNAVIYSAILERKYF